MPRILKDLTITEVSSVDRGAGEGVKVLLMKRLTETGAIDMDPKELAALIAKSVNEAVGTATATIQKSLDEATATITILKMSPAHKAFYDDLKDEGAKKAFSDMDEKGRDAECAKVKKAAEVDPAVAELAKRADTLSAENADLRKRLDTVDLEKAQASFKKMAADLGATADGDGELMRKAYSGDKEAQTAWTNRIAEITKALRAQADAGGVFKTFGSDQGGHANGNAYSSLMAKAEEYQKAHPELSIQQAFTKVYTDPSNITLKKSYESEEARGRAQVVA